MQNIQALGRQRTSSLQLPYTALQLLGRFDERELDPIDRACLIGARAQGTALHVAMRKYRFGHQHLAQLRLHDAISYRQAILHSLMREGTWKKMQCNECHLIQPHARYVIANLPERLAAFPGHKLVRCCECGAISKKMSPLATMVAANPTVAVALAFFMACALFSSLPGVIEHNSVFTVAAAVALCAAVTAVFIKLNAQKARDLQYTLLFPGGVPETEG